MGHGLGTTMMAIAMGLAVLGPLPTLASGGKAASGSAFAAPDSLPAVMTCAERGALAARTCSSTGAFTIGFGSGLVLGPVGTVLAISSQGRPHPPASASDDLTDRACKESYCMAYGDLGRDRKRAAALVGGLLGTATLIGVGAVILVSSVASPPH